MIIKDVSMVNRNFDVLRDMYVMTDGAYIAYVGKQDPRDVLVTDEHGNKRKRFDFRVDDIIDGRGKLLMPAFYNTHCHIPMTLLRGYGENLPLHRWLNERIFPFEAKFRPEEKYAGAKLGCIELMRSGCVSVSDMYFDLPDYGQAIYELGMKANLSNSMANSDDNASYFDDNSYRDTMALLEWLKTHNDGRIIADASVHAEYSTREKSVREACEFAADNHMRMQVHISETQEEHDACKERHNGMTPIQYFESCGMFKNPVTAAHCVYIEECDMEIMNHYNTFLSNCVSSNLKLGSGIAPTKKYYDNHLRITIGTDGAASNNNLDMLEEVHLASMICRGEAKAADAIPVKEMLIMATRNGALAQGREDVGYIEEGMRADLVMFDMNKPHLVPNYDPIANIVFSAQSEDICLTVCDGRILYKNGEVLVADEEKIVEEACKAFALVQTRI